MDVAVEPRDLVASCRVLSVVCPVFVMVELDVWDGSSAPGTSPMALNVFLPDTVKANSGVVF